MEQKISILLYHLRTYLAKKKLDSFYVSFSILLNQSGNFKLFVYMLLLVPFLKILRIQLGLIVALISTKAVLLLIVVYYSKQILPGINFPWVKIAMLTKVLPLIFLFPINQVLTSQSNNVSLIIFPFRQ